jgi:hypothetical protein
MDPREDADVQRANLAKPDQGWFLKTKRAVGRFVKRLGLWIAAALWAVAVVVAFMVHFHLWPEGWPIFPEKELPALERV